jgi:hypothetical protein
MCAVTAAKISAASKRPVEDVASELTSSYSEYQDRSLATEIAEAAYNISGFIQKELPPESIVGNLTQIQFCIKNYHPNGNKKRSRILGGTFFNKERKELEDKVKQCVANVATYHYLVINGTIPIAPQGWSL